VTYEPGPFRGKISDTDGYLAVPGGSMATGNAEGHLGISVQPPFPLARLRAKVGFAPDEGGVKRLCPIEIGHAQVEDRAREFEFHQPTVSDLTSTHASTGHITVSQIVFSTGTIMSPPLILVGIAGLLFWERA
jgi:hypothetical protein